VTFFQKEGAKGLMREIQATVVTKARLKTLLGTWAVAAIVSISVTNFSLAAEPSAFKFNAETQTRQELVQVALGRDPADLIIRGPNVLNAFTLQWEPDQDIVIKGQRIAWVGPAKTWPGKCENIVSAVGEWAVPGFGESHKHIESTHVTPEYEAALVIAGGNTWTIDGTHEFGNVDGEHNVEFWLKARNAGSMASTCSEARICTAAP